MRKLVLAAVGATALATASVGNAAIIVGGSSGIDVSSINVFNGATISTVDWAKNPQAAGSFTGWIEFNNSLSGMYQIVVSSSTFHAIIDSATLSGLGGSPIFSQITGNTTNSLTLGPTDVLAPGGYRFTFTGSVPTTGAVSGNLTFQLVPIAVPEPGTWAMMLAGFAGIGLAMRRRRRPVLAQIA